MTPPVIARHIGAEAISCYNGAMTGKERVIDNYNLLTKLES